MNINRLKVTAWLAVFIVVFCSVTLAGTWYVQRNMCSLVAKAQEVRLSDISGEEDVQRIKPMLDDIENSWKKYEALVSMYSRHDEVERVSQEIEWLAPLYDNGYYTQLNIKLVGINDALEHLLQTERPSIANIL